jgi:pre-rRNA-processing protein TSR2
MATSSKVNQPKPDIVLFARGVIAILETWPALKLAIDESWGGPDGANKRLWMAGEIVDAFETPPSDGIPDDQYIEEMLLQIISDEFDTTLEDGSAERVGKDVVKLWNDIQVKKIGEQEVTRLESQSNKQRGKKVTAKVEVNSDDELDGEGSGDEWVDDDEDDEEPPRLINHQPREPEQPEVDGDGFTLVKRKGKR